MGHIEIPDVKVPGSLQLENAFLAILLAEQVERKAEQVILYCLYLG